MLAAVYERGEPGVVARDSVTAAALRARVPAPTPAALADLRETAEGFGGQGSLEGRALLESVARLETAGRA